MDVLKWLMYLIHALISIALITLVVLQTSKAEGLGSVGGATGPALRGRAGPEEKLAEYTRYLAVAFMAFSILLYILAHKFGWT